MTIYKRKHKIVCFKMAKRFADMSDAKIEAKRQNTVPKETNGCNEKAKHILDYYVEEKGMAPNNYHEITALELDRLLTKFCLEAGCDKIELMCRGLSLLFH